MEKLQQTQVFTMNRESDTCDSKGYEEYRSGGSSTRSDEFGRRVGDFRTFLKLDEFEVAQGRKSFFCHTCHNQPV